MGKKINFLKKISVAKGIIILIFAGILSWGIFTLSRDLLIKIVSKFGYSGNTATLMIVIVSAIVLIVMGVSLSKVLGGK